MIFHPDYSTNGYFYVYYISGSGAGQSNVARYQVSGGDPNLANPASQKPILSFTQPFSNHNGGKLQFGNDGYLYISTGDGGSGGDPLNNGQSLNTLLGKLLRIDVDIDPGTYNIPSDNPFVGNGSALDEIWAYGLRNPWQYSFDSLTHDLYIADVGQNVWEEINFTSSESTGGENYGWRIMEGAHCYPSDPCDDTGLQYPVAEYSHAFGCSITGIGVCRASTEPDITGIYFAGDYCSGRIWGLARNLADEWIFTELLDTSELITGAGEDPDGNIYFTTYTSSGALYMIEQM
jgi:glucose/arabinose dehydrogenase